MTSQLTRRAFLGATVLVASLAGASGTQAQQAGIMVGATAPDAVVQTLDGGTVRLSTLGNGKPVLLEFWATWCPLCKRLEPAMAAAQAKHGTDIAFVSVGVRDNQTAEAQRAYATAHKLGGQFVFDGNGEAVKAFQVPHTSFIVIIDAAGKVAYTGVGPEQDIEAALGHVKAGMGMD